MPPFPKATSREACGPPGRARSRVALSSYSAWNHGTATLRDWPQVLRSAGIHGCEAHAVLSDPTTTKPISAIAEDLCFTDASSFSRTFRRGSGHSPSEVRSAALAVLAPSAAPRSRVLSDHVEFGELLHEF